MRRAALIRLLFGLSATGMVLAGLVLINSLGCNYEMHLSSKEADYYAVCRAGKFTVIERDRYGLRYVWQAGNPMFDTLEARADHQVTKSYGITRITAGSGTSANPTASSVTTACTLALPCQRAEDRNDEQKLDRFAVDMDKALEGDG